MKIISALVSRRLFIFAFVFIAQTAASIMYHYQFYRMLLSNCFDMIPFALGVLVTFQFPAIVGAFVLSKNKYLAAIFGVLLIGIWVYLWNEAVRADPQGDCIEPIFSIWIQLPFCG